MKVKICGITNREDALSAVSLGADAIGFIFYENSPRYITLNDAEEITMFLPPFIQVVGVFVNHTKEFIDEAVSRCRLDVIQLHGDETPQFCRQMRRRVIKAFKVSDSEDLEPLSQYQGEVSAFLLDTKVEGMEGGSGRVFDWGLALMAKEFETPLILSGGVKVGNIKKAVKMVNPYAVDVCSGVEASPGKKDYHKLEEFISLAKGL